MYQNCLYIYSLLMHRFTTTAKPRRDPFIITHPGYDATNFLKEDHGRAGGKIDIISAGKERCPL